MKVKIHREYPSLWRGIYIPKDVSESLGYQDHVENEYRIYPQSNHLHPFVSSRILEIIVLYLPKMWSFVSKMIICIIHTVDGRNPAPSGMYKPSKWWDVYHINWWSPDFFHQTHLPPPKTDYIPPHDVQTISAGTKLRWSAGVAEWRIGIVNMRISEFHWRR